MGKTYRANNYNTYRRENKENRKRTNIEVRRENKRILQDLELGADDAEAVFPNRPKTSGWRTW